MERDDLLRARCFLALDSLRARLGDDLPYAGALDAGFVFDDRRVPFLNPYKGIHRAREQRGSAALSIMTSHRNPYSDAETDDGFGYAYRAGAVDQPDNRALREAHVLGVPIVYFVGTRPGTFRAVYPCFVTVDDPMAGRVQIAPGTTTILGDAVPPDALERRYLVRDARVRLHQARFRGLVLTAYHDRCTICRLREPRLLDASHIIPDADPEGVAQVRNGLALCTIHHRAFDQNLIGISPRFHVHVAARLLDDEDGPMLDLLKRAHGIAIDLPGRVRSRPDPDLLAERFERFTAA